MDLVNRYLQAVKFWLPKEQKNDIAAELSADIDRSIVAPGDRGAPVALLFLGHPARLCRECTDGVRKPPSALPNSGACCRSPGVQRVWLSAVLSFSNANIVVSVVAARMTAAESMVAVSSFNQWASMLLPYAVLTGVVTAAIDLYRLLKLLRRPEDQRPYLQDALNGRI